MANLSGAKLVEAGFWLVFAVLAFTFSFEFDREIEIYRFGAAGWPRAVILLIVVAALGQLLHGARREATEPRQAEPSGGAEAGPRDRGYYPRIALMLLLPVGYAAVLDYTGFYFTTPVFLALYLYVIGERRPVYLVLVPLGIYLLLLLFFTKLLYVGLPVGYLHPFYDFSNWLLVLLD